MIWRCCVAASEAGGFGDALISGCSYVHVRVGVSVCVCVGCSCTGKVSPKPNIEYSSVDDFGFVLLVLGLMWRVGVFVYVS